MSRPAGGLAKYLTHNSLKRISTQLELSKSEGETWPTFPALEYDRSLMQEEVDLSKFPIVIISSKISRSVEEDSYVKSHKKRYRNLRSRQYNVNKKVSRLSHVWDYHGYGSLEAWVRILRLL